MSERGGEGCGPILFGGLSVIGAGMIFGAWLQVQRYSPPDGGGSESPPATAIATATTAIAEVPEEKPEVISQPALEISPMSPEEVAARINAHQVGDEFVVIRNDNLHILVKKKENYLMLLKIYNGQDFWADRVSPENIIFVDYIE